LAASGEAMVMKKEKDPNKPDPSPRGPEDEPVGDEQKEVPKVEEPKTPDANPIDPRVFDRPGVGNRDAARKEEPSKK